jgi:hypothetical protein
MTDSEDHVWRLACNREGHGRTDIHIAIIDRDLLESQVDVYRMLDLVDATNAEIAPKGTQLAGARLRPLHTDKHDRTLIHNVRVCAVPRPRLRRR